MSFLETVIRNMINRNKSKCIWCNTPYDKTDHYCRYCGSNLSSQKDNKYVVA